MNIYKEIVEEILSAKNIVITAHRSPDGDSIGSSMGLYQFIQKLGKKAVVCHPDPAPEFLHWVENTAAFSAPDAFKLVPKNVPKVTNHAPQIKNSRNIMLDILILLVVFIKIIGFG
jgi:hypothetical protein